MNRRAEACRASTLKRDIERNEAYEILLSSLLV